MSGQAHTTCVFLADDSEIIRERMATLLNAGQIAVIGQAGTPQACIEGILATHPDVVVLDVQLDGGTGIEVLRSIHRTNPEVGFVVFSIHAEPVYRTLYLREGARRFLDKATEVDQLVRAVQDAAQRSG